MLTAQAAPSAPPAQTDAEAKPQRRTGLLIGGILGALVLIVGAVVGIALVANTLNAAPDPQETEDVVDPKEVLPAGTPEVTELAGVRNGAQVSFTWTNPEPQDGDYYIWEQIVLSGESKSEKANEPTVTFTPQGAGQVCIEVSLVRADGDFAEPVRGCVD